MVRDLVRRGLQWGWYAAVVGILVLSWVPVTHRVGTSGGSVVDHSLAYFVVAALGLAAHGRGGWRVIVAAMCLLAVVAETGQIWAIGRTAELSHAAAGIAGTLAARLGAALVQKLAGAGAFKPEDAA